MDVLLYGFGTLSLLASLLVTVALLATGAFCLIHALRAPADAFTAADQAALERMMQDVFGDL